MIEWVNVRDFIILDSEENKNGNSPSIPLESECRILNEKENQEKDKDEENDQDQEKDKDEENDSKHDKIKKILGKKFYWKKFGIILSNSLASLLLVLIRGSSGFKSIIGIKICSSYDFIFLAAYIMVTLILNFLGYYVLYKEQKEKENINFPKYEGEIFWTKKYLCMGAICSFSIGLISSITGTGGGSLINPFFMYLNYLPMVSSFTSMYLVMIGKITAAILHLITGELPIYYLLVTGILVIIGILISENLLAHYIKKIGRQSIITFIFFGLAVGALLLVIYSGYRNIRSDIEENMNSALEIMAVFMDSDNF